MGLMNDTSQKGRACLCNWDRGVWQLASHWQDGSSRQPADSSPQGKWSELHQPPVRGSFSFMPRVGGGSVGWEATQDGQDESHEKIQRERREHEWS